jgi:SNF2-related domain
MQGIYLRLFRYRERPSRSPLEDYLTEALADLLSRCPLDVGKAFIADVLVGANAKSSWLKLSKSLRDLVWRTQVTIPDGRLDLVIESNGRCLFVVENKVSSGIRLYKAELDEDEIDNEIEGESSNTNGSARGHHDGELAETEASEESEIELRNQLECYGTWLAKQPRPSGWKGGLTLLTHFTTPPVDFLDANASGYGPVWRRAHGSVPQGAIVLRDHDGRPQQAVLGAFAFTTEGLGITPGNPLSLIQASETTEESERLSQWFDAQWAGLKTNPSNKAALIKALNDLAAHQDPLRVYALVLLHLFRDRGEDLDEERIVKSATGIRNTVVWKKLFRFQRDGVIGAIDKLNRFGGCIIADSVGLGKTFEALAIIKYNELRNDRVLVLCPKRLRDNWTLYKANDRRNFLAPDRFNYDVLNHTDLSRDGGLSGDIDLSNVKWGNYDLVVIDESHNFRNKKTPRQGSETRYDRLMRMIIKEGVKTRVLMLSATPVNNRMADLRNQIVFATEGDDNALLEYGISSIDSTTRLAQKQFNRWLELDDAERTPAQLIEMLGFDYFTLLDLLTIARSRKHIEKYYGTSETGRFPDRLKGTSNNCRSWQSRTSLG